MEGRVNLWNHDSEGIGIVSRFSTYLQHFFLPFREIKSIASLKLKNLKNSGHSH